MTEPIARIEAALRDLGADHEPPAGWQARVLAATGARKPWRWWWFAAPVVALAAVVIIWNWPHEPGLQIALAYTPGPVVVRGDTSRHAGDVVHATVTGGGPYHAVWIYRNEALVMACPGARECRITPDAVTADATLTMGRYMIVALRSSSPLPTPAGSYDADLATAEDAGADVKKERVEVH